VKVKEVIKLLEEDVGIWLEPKVVIVNSSIPIRLVP
jgi:hypothetical protein